MPQARNLQNEYLEALKRDSVPVSIFLVNGIKLQGQIDSFDQYVILLKSASHQVIFKHAISTVVPSRELRLSSSAAE